MDFDWKTAYERLVSKVTDQLDLLEEWVLKGEISSKAVHKIIKKLIQDEQSKLCASTQLKSQSQPQSYSSVQDDSVNTFSSLTVSREETSQNVNDQENVNGVSYSNTEMQNVTIENLDLPAVAQSQSEEVEKETNENVQPTQIQTDTIYDVSLEPNQTQFNHQDEQVQKDIEKKSHLNKKPFKCPKCPYTTKWKTSVKAHLKNVHQSSRPFSCPHPGCNYTTKQKGHLPRHMTSHSGEKPFFCAQPNCSFATSRKDNLKAHIRRHTGEKPWVCPFESCSFAATTSSELVNHSRKHTKEKPFKCPQPNCGYSAGSSSAFYAHRNCHDQEQKASFPCPLCEYSTKWKGVLQTHVKTHSLEKPFVCSFEACNFKTKCKANLSTHLKTHSVERRYKCELCPFRGKTRPTVKIHLKNVHSDPKSWTFKCKEPKCDFVTRTNRILQRHLLTHSQEQKYACSFPDCDYLARAIQNVKQHELNVHSDERKEKCRLCDFKCKTKYSLVSHLRTHTKEEPFKCNEQNCEYRAKTSGALKSHQKKHDPQISNRENI